MKLNDAISIAIRVCIESAVEQSGGNVKRAALLIGVHRTHLYKLASVHGARLPKRPRAIAAVPELAQWSRP